MSSEIHHTVNTAEAAFKLKSTIAPVLMAIYSAFTFSAPADEQKPGFWQKHVQSPTSPAEEAVRQNAVVEKTLKLTALLDISSPNSPSLASHLKLKQPKLRAVDEKQLLLQDEPITCVSSIHSIILNAAEALDSFSKQSGETHSITVRMNAALVAQELTSFTANTDNTHALMEMESRAASAQQASKQRVA